MMRRLLVTLIDRYLLCSFCWCWCREDAETFGRSWSCARSCRFRNAK